MKKIFLISLIIVHSCIAFAQNYCVNDTIVREIQFPLTLDDKTEFFYFNDEWIPGAHPGLVSVDSIQKAEVKMTSMEIVPSFDSIARNSYTNKNGSEKSQSRP